MYLKGFVRYHKLNIAIFLFLVIFTSIHLLKPGLIYDKDGSFREFGVGYRHKTVVPIWVISIILAILCYLAVSYFIMIA
uniref:Uncharacterized protein n=1 Tax=viral metagenome TaxID=1070528 RepID=A0A6C0JJA0_9ZZZZ